MSTIYDVAKLAGVGKSTVSRVINKNGAIKESTRLKVEAAMKELNYRPSLFAQGIKTGRSKTICLLYTSDLSPGAVRGHSFCPGPYGIRPASVRGGDVRAHGSLRRDQGKESQAYRIHCGRTLLRDIVNRDAGTAGRRQLCLWHVAFASGILRRIPEQGVFSSRAAECTGSGRRSGALCTGPEWN